LGKTERLLGCFTIFGESAQVFRYFSPSFCDYSATFSSMFINYFSPSWCSVPPESLPPAGNTEHLFDDF
jgi:hypothetical protein